MKTTDITMVGALTLCSLLSGCAGTSALRMPEAPEALRPPPDQSLFLEAVGKGVQIYQCAAVENRTDRFAWTFKFPEAVLFDRDGRKIGKHYAGPTWESTDGSRVIGQVAAADNGPDPSSIPWLLLNATTVTGTGVFSKTFSIQRLQTSGGVSPSQPCGPEQAKQTVRVPYSATYYFYTAKP